LIAAFWGMKVDAELAGWSGGSGDEVPRSVDVSDVGSRNPRSRFQPPGDCGGWILP
jgi:hypothetical protein